MKSIMFWTSRLEEDQWDAPFLLIQHWCDYGHNVPHVNDYLPLGLPFVAVGDVRMALTKAAEYQKKISMGKQDHQTALKGRLRSFSSPDTAWLQGKSSVAAVYEKCGNPECACKGTPLRTLHACAACKSIRYCSHECQKRHWKLHKSVCKDLCNLRTER